MLEADSDADSDCTDSLLAQELAMRALLNSLVFAIWQLNEA